MKLFSPYNINALEKRVVMRIEWSGKTSPTDNSTNSPHYVYGKSIGTVNENLNFDVRVKGLKPIHTRVLLPEHAPGSFCTASAHEGSYCGSLLHVRYTRGSVFKFTQFAPGACFQIFNRLNTVEHFAGWKFCSRGWSMPMKGLVHTEELCSRSVPLENAPGAKPLVCISL